MVELSLEQAFTRADFHVERGEVSEARKFYKAILTAVPNNEKAQAALTALQDVQALTDTQSPPQEVITQLLNLYNSGNLEAVVDQASLLTEQHPEAFVVWNILGAANKGLGDLDKASQAFKKVTELNPSLAEPHNNMGVTLQDQGKLEEALVAFNRVLDLHPDHTEVHYNIGNAFQSQSRLEEAIEAYKKALFLKPDHVDAHYNIGKAFQSQGQLEEAILSYSKALSLKPNYADAYNNMGVALRELDKLEEAIKVYTKALFFNPNYAEVYLNMGNVLTDQSKLEEAVEAYNKSLSLKSDDPKAYLNMGNVLKDQGKMKEAIASYEKALSLKHDYVDAIWNRSLAYLSMEDFNRGWAQYDKRWKQSNNTSIPFQSSKPSWKPNKSGRVLIWPEQGLGDLIMFSSVIPEIYKQSKKLIVQIDERLIPLFKRSFPTDIIYYGVKERITEEQYDFHIPIGSLPLYFRKELQSFKLNNGPYLKADTSRADNLRSKLLSNGTKNLIGISWHSTNHLKGAQKRVVSLSKLASILGSQKTKLISLQYGDVEKDIVDLFNDFNIKVYQVPEINNKNDIDGLASLIIACDSIVSIDNSTIHLAGALGKKSKLLLPYACEWRWGRNSNKSYWYNSVELYRQKEIGNWDEVISKL